MPPKTVSEYINSVELTARRLGLVGSIAISAGCTRECGHCHGDGEIEFSAKLCDLCGALPGGRYAAHYLLADELYHLDVCSDCALYVDYGDIPEHLEMDYEGAI